MAHFFSIICNKTYGYTVCLFYYVNILQEVWRKSLSIMFRWVYWSHFQEPMRQLFIPIIHNVLIENPPSVLPSASLSEMTSHLNTKFRVSRPSVTLVLSQDYRISTLMITMPTVPSHLPAEINTQELGRGRPRLINWQQIMWDLIAM